MVEGAPYVGVGEVPEDPAQQHQVGRGHPGVGVGRGGVPGDHLDLVEPGLGGGAARVGDVALVQLDQPGPYVVPARVPGQHPDQVPSLPRAHADRA